MNFQRTVWLSLGLGILVPLMAGAAPADPVAARVHFSGGNLLGQDANAALLNALGTNAATVNFRAAVVRKSAAVLAESLGTQLNGAGVDAKLFEPMLEDTISCESVSLLGGRNDAPLGFVMAIHLSDIQAKVWQDSFARMLVAAPEALVASGYQGSAWTKAGVRVVRAKEWLVVSRGNDLSAQFDELLANVSKSGRPAAALQTNWFDADVDWPRMANWLPLSSCPFKLARTHVSLAMKNGQIATSMDLHYPQPLGWTGQPWRIPTEHVRDPIDSFTAVRNVAPLLASSTSLGKLKLNPWVEQIFVWAGDSLPFQTLAAIPVDHSTNLLHELIAQIPALFNAKMGSIGAGPFIELTNQTGLHWLGVGLVAPILRAGSEKSGDFLFAEFMPASPTNLTRPVPPELLEFSTHKDVVYYDWELTNLRLKQWQPMAEMLPILRATSPLISSNSPAGELQMAVNAMRARSAWLGMMANQLGVANTITEVTVTGPSDVKLARKSPVGFTAIELVMLSNWLTGAGHFSQAVPTVASPGVMPALQQQR